MYPETIIQRGGLRLRNSNTRSRKQTVQIHKSVGQVEPFRAEWVIGPVAEGRVFR